MAGLPVAQEHEASPPPRRRAGAATWAFAAFAVAYYVYARFLADLYTYPGGEADFPIFSTRPSFLYAALQRPGGITEYMAGFLAQALYSRWLGPLVLTALAVAVVLGTDALVRASGAPHLRWLALAPGALLLTALNYQLYQPLGPLGLALAVSCAGAWSWVRIRREVVRAALVVVAGFVFYYVAAGPFLLFALLCAIYEGLIRRSGLVALVAVFSMEAIPYLSFTRLFVLTPRDAFLCGLPLQPPFGIEESLGLAAAYGSAVLVCLVAGVSRALSMRRGQVPSASGAGARRFRWASTVVWAVLVLAWLALTAATYDGNARRARRLRYCARIGQWEGVLREARQLPLAYRGREECQHISRALFELGKLSESMFSFDQAPGTLAVDIVDPQITPTEANELMEERDRVWSDIADFNLALGDVNWSEHQAHEALTTWGEQPQVLLHLAYCKLVKGQPEAARAFLEALSGDLVYGSKARELLRRMDGDPLLKADAEIAHWRSIMLTEDYPVIWSVLPTRCQHLLACNPRNRMAFEYLMAAYLLLREVGYLAAEMHRLPELGYDHVPRHYEEAILLFQREHGGKVDCGGLAISEAGLQSFVDFTEAMNAAAGRPDAPAGVPAALAKRFGRTYYFYYYFGSPGPHGL
jgi:hypothetical protein